jgi:hypothetical protein
VPFYTGDTHVTPDKHTNTGAHHAYQLALVSTNTGYKVMHPMSCAAPEQQVAGVQIAVHIPFDAYTPCLPPLVQHDQNAGSTYCLAVRPRPPGTRHGRSHHAASRPTKLLNQIDVPGREALDASSTPLCTLRSEQSRSGACCSSTDCCARNSEEPPDGVPERFEGPERFEWGLRPLQMQPRSTAEEGADA